MAEAKDRARAAAKHHVTVAIDGDLPRTDDSLKYKSSTASAHVLGWVENNAYIGKGELHHGDDEVLLILDRTCFYAEQGGQIGDTGGIQTKTGKFTVHTTQKLGDAILHIGTVTAGMICAGQPAELQVDDGRELTRKNHTATHLCHWALRTVCGDGVKQHGSVVDPERLRFDFDHNAPLTADQIAEVERLVNDKVCADVEVKTLELPIDEARKLPGVRAFFGEKYGDVVRVVNIGDGFSAEFCGGTHLSRTGEIGFFKIVGEEAVAKGVRRVTGVTALKAVAAVHELERNAWRAAALLQTNPEQMADRVAGLQEEIKKLRKQVTKGAAADIKGVRQKILDDAERVGGVAIAVGELPEAPVVQVREAADWLRTQAGSAVVCLATVGDGKPMLLAAVTEDLVKKGIKAGDLIKDIAQHVEGRGGGKPELAQAGGLNPAGIPKALEAAKAWIRKKIES